MEFHVHEFPVHLDIERSNICISGRCAGTFCKCFCNICNTCFSLIYLFYCCQNSRIIVECLAGRIFAIIHVFLLSMMLIWYKHFARWITLEHTNLFQVTFLLLRLPTLRWVHQYLRLYIRLLLNADMSVLCYQYYGFYYTSNVTFMYTEILYLHFI